MTTRNFARPSQNNYITGRRLMLHAGAALGLVLGAAESALAQTAAATSDSEIVVTGSRIRGVDPVGSAVVGLNREDIVEAGAPSTSDLLRKLPLVVGLGASETASGAQNGAANVTRGVSINLRGIGSNATLLLFNGRRMPPAGTQGQITDASVIPSIALERIEVIADGGSAIYGSDAVTGVANMIPRTRFVGQQSQARYGEADGYTDWSVAHLAGFKWDTGRLTLAGDYTEHSNLRGLDRDFYTSNLAPRGGADGRSTQCAPGNIVAAPGTATPNVTTGTYYLNPTTAAQPTYTLATTPNKCDNTKKGELVPALARTSFFGSVEQEVSPDITVFAEGFWSRRKIEATSYTQTSDLTVPNTNAFYVNPAGGTGPVVVRYDLARDGGSYIDYGHAQSWQTVLGFRANLPAEWQLEAYASHGESEDVTNRKSGVNTAALTPLLASNNPAVAFNPFGGTNSAANIAAIRTGLFVIAGETTLDVLSAQVDGPLFNVGGGAARMAFGAEYRKEGLGGSLTSGTTTAPVIVPSDTSRDEWAVFTELALPLVGESNAMAGVQRLNLSLAARYEEYSDFGNTLNPKVGLVWTPFDAIDVRGSWGKSFRAPGLAETDPKSSGYGLYGDNLPCATGTCFGIGIAGGNPGLSPETADTWSVGFDLHPEMLKGFRASATYFDIQYENQILGLRGTAGLLTNPLYAQFRNLTPTQAEIIALLNSGLPNNAAGGVINPTAVTYIQDGRRQNLGGSNASGIDADISQRFETGAGVFSLGVQATYFTKVETAIAAGAPFVDVLSTLNNPQRWRGRASAGWSNGPFNARLFANYVGTYDQVLATSTVPIESFTTLDLHLGFDVPVENGIASGFSIGLDASNLLDEEPPFVNQGAGYDAQSASPIGRLVAISIRKDW